MNKILASKSCDQIRKKLHESPFNTIITGQLFLFNALLQRDQLYLLSIPPYFPALDPCFCRRLRWSRPILSLYRADLNPDLVFSPFHPSTWIFCFGGEPVGQHQVVFSGGHTPLGLRQWPSMFVSNSGCLHFVGPQYAPVAAITTSLLRHTVDVCQRSRPRSRIDASLIRPPAKATGCCVMSSDCVVCPPLWLVGGTECLHAKIL